jgi:sialidase-1
MKKTFPALTLLAAFLTPAVFAQAASFFQTNLFSQGQNGVNTYRIPALVQTPQGTLIAVVDARHDSSHDLPANISLVMRRSFDEGRHWGPIRTIVAVKAGGVGDASLLLDHSNGRIWCFFNYGPPGIGFMTAKAGSRTGPTTLQVHAMYSDDQGVTWSRPVDLSPQIKDPSWQAMFATSGTDIQLHTGRFLVPLVVRDSHGVIHSVNAYSDDHGRTWKVGKFIGTGTNESHNVELANGIVLQNMRDGKSREIAESKDGGITFGPGHHDKALIDPGCNAGITSEYRGKRQLIIFSNAASTTRRNLTVKISEDEGRTWPIARVINPGTSAYSTVIPLRDGSIGVLYERGGPDAVAHITFARFTLSWVRQGPAK